MNNSINVYKCKYITKIRERIFDLSKEKNETNSYCKNKIIIGCIPSHSRIQGNELVDMLTKEATDEDADDRIKIPINDWKIIFKKEMYNRTRERLKREGTYKGVKYFNTLQ